jgi:prepilin-type N-terminal cleavage/methylation domain-containing protein
VAPPPPSADDEFVILRPTLLGTVSRLTRRLRDERGFTLTELLTAMSILAIVIGSLATVFVSGSNAEIDLSSRFKAQQDGRIALDAFRRETHNSCKATQTSSADVTLWSIDTTPGPTDGSCTVPNTWCAVGGGQRFALHRKAGSTCDASGRRYADYLTTSAVFSLPARAAGKLPQVGVDLTVDLKPADTARRYRLQDQIALRNFLRS